MHKLSDGELKKPKYTNHLTAYIRNEQNMAGNLSTDPPALNTDLCEDLI